MEWIGDRLKFAFSPDVIPCGWLGSKHQLTVSPISSAWQPRHVSLALSISTCQFRLVLSITASCLVNLNVTVSPVLCVESLVSSVLPCQSPLSLLVLSRLSGLVSLHVSVSSCLVSLVSSVLSCHPPFVLLIRSCFISLNLSINAVLSVSSCQV